MYRNFFVQVLQPVFCSRLCAMTLMFSSDLNVLQTHEQTWRGGILMQDSKM